MAITACLLLTSQFLLCLISFFFLLNAACSSVVPKQRENFELAIVIMM